MSLRSLVLLCVLGLALSERMEYEVEAVENASPLCPTCLTVEGLYMAGARAVFTQAHTAFNLIKKGCTTIPPQLAQPCGTLIGVYEGAFNLTERIATASKPCEQFLGCQASAEDSILDINEINPGPLCNICETIAAGLFDTIQLDSVISQFKDRMLDVCGSLGMFEEADCSKWIDNLVSQVDIPDKETFCIQLGLCPM